ncbi:hypothetical protein CW745_00230 [Psychromonas sp. psych-6C06]|uniref:DUF6162 family protein n=1 Tax=Psychromonas sp. psych-6C06 TaxID=2058089 RepID=UPI000C32DD49|nr:hypothetical protein [Psychromonas sp. psych-6C06]PKF63318.1 hypothetical protein CW745_00230 [Psychromonas sp. psych-6C06]
MIIQPVISENGRKEGKWIAFLCALILLIGALLLPYNQTSYKKQSLAKHQIEISALTTKPLAMIAELKLAHEEIRYQYQAQLNTSEQWPSVAQLASQWIAPFVKDKSWLHHGKQQWQLVANGIYQGVPLSSNGEPKTRYLLNSQHSQVEIWLDLKGDARLLAEQVDRSAIVQSRLLIESGWQQVVFESDER